MRYIKDRVTGNKVTTEEFITTINTMTPFTARLLSDTTLRVDGTDYFIDDYLVHHNAIYGTELELY